MNATDRNSQTGAIVPAALLLGLCLIACAFVVRSTLITMKGYGRTIQVTGSAVKPITSDFAIWEGNLTSSSLDLNGAYAKIKKDLSTTQSFLASEGFTAEQIQIGNVQVNRSFDREGRPSGYSLYQSIKIEIADVPRISSLALKASSLIEQGVELNAFAPRFLYTKLENEKIEMIRLATENARVRADQLASTTKMNVGSPLSARVGVFQIRPARSQEVSDYGINDMSSRDKEIVSTVNITFLIE